MQKTPPQSENPGHFLRIVVSSGYAYYNELFKFVEDLLITPGYANLETEKENQQAIQQYNRMWVEYQKQFLNNPQRPVPSLQEFGKSLIKSMIDLLLYMGRLLERLQKFESMPSLERYAKLFVGFSVIVFDYWWELPPQIRTEYSWLLGQQNALVNSLQGVPLSEYWGYREEGIDAMLEALREKSQALVEALSQEALIQQPPQPYWRRLWLWLQSFHLLK